MRNFYWIVFLLLLFAISVVVRLPYLGCPLGGHQWLTAQMLVIHSIWYERGITACYFNPVVTFGLPTDKNVITPMGRMASPDGDRYFISQPPLGYILPYIVIVLLGVRPDVLPLQIFNLGLHLACVLLVFLIIRSLALQRGARNPDMPALAGSVVYQFMPVTLQYHGNVYSFEVLVQVFFLLAVYLFLRVPERPMRPIWLYVWLAAAAFCMSYTEWLGVLFALSTVLYAFFHFHDNKVRWAVVAVIAGTTVALCLTLIQYSQIAGAAELLQRAVGTYLERSGFSKAFSHENQSLWSGGAWHRLGQHYMDSFGWLPFVIAVAAFRYINIMTRLTSKERAVIWVALAPVVLHHLLLFDFTSIHDYSVLKDTIFFSILVGMLFYLLQDLQHSDFVVGAGRRLFKFFLVAALG
jgi:hypothetical protein